MGNTGMIRVWEVYGWIPGSFVWCYKAKVPGKGLKIFLFVQAHDT